MNIKVPAIIALLALLGWFTYQAVAPAVETPTEQAGADQVADSDPGARTEASNEVPTAPDFDRRTAQVTPAKTPVEDYVDVDTSPAAMAQHEQQLKALIDQYNDSLDDPQAKKDYERKFKALSENYKKAVLAKLKKDEL